MTRRSLPLATGPRLSRRHLLAGAGAGLAAGFVGPAPAVSRPRDVDYAIRQVVGEAPVRDGGIVLDVPEHSDTGTAVPLAVRMDPAHAAEVPKVVYVFADGNPRPNILSIWFQPDCGRAEVSTRIRLESTQAVVAVAIMPDGTVWRDRREVTVNFGACADVGSGTDAEIRDFKPETRVSVPKSAHPGEVIAIRALISHPMETGLRLNAFNTWVPLRIVEEFSCSFEGREVIRIRPYPAISTNPYFSFFTRAERGGTFRFTWQDTNGMVFTNSASIEVG